MIISYTYTVSATITAAVSAVSISASTASYAIQSTAAPTSDIEASVYIVPLVPLAEERAFIFEDAIYDVGVNKDDDVTVTEVDTKEINLVPSDSVTVTESTFKVFTNPVDFDPSDDDVDPDPITPSDQINTFGVGLSKTDAVTATESDAKSFEFGGFTDAAGTADAQELDLTKPLTDSLTAVEGAKFSPHLSKTDSATAADAITKFDPRLGKADDVTASEGIDKFDVVLTKTDFVNVTDVSVKNFTENVDFDRNDADADPDPVTMSEIISLGASKPRTDAVSPSDVNIFNFTKVSTDSITAAESIYLNLILGESSYMYPSRVDISDGSNKFVQDWFRFSKLDYTAQLNGGDSLLNSDVIWGGSAEDLARAPFTGVIGSDGFIGQVVVNSDTITYPDTSNAGLVVNFLYTEADDTTLGGYYLNQTPISAGSIEGGDRTIL